MATTVNTLDKDQKPFDSQVEQHHPNGSLERYDSSQEKTPSSLEADPVGGVHNLDAGFAPEEVKRITKKIDFRLIPVLSMMYAISLIDRTNLAIARSANEVRMDKELGTNIGSRYSIITLVFFIPYIVFEIPSQFGLRKFGAKLWLGSAVVLWGIVMLGMGCVPNWSGLAALRAVLGIFESALFPGAAYLISCWYPRKDMGLRNSIFYITSACAGSFTKLLGWVFSLLDGKAGRSGWRWIFIIYGCVTIVIGLLAYLLITDFPDKAKFLTEDERHIVITRIERDRADSKPDPLTSAKMFKYMLLWQPWLFALMFMSMTTATYSLAYFLPTILATMGFDNVQSLVLGTPAYFWAIIPSLISGRVADKVKGARSWVIVFNACCLLVGTCMYSQLKISQKAARFAGIFLAVGGANANIPLIISWQHTSIRSQSLRGFCSALTVAFGGIGGIVGSTVFMEKEKKQGYPTGIYVSLALNAFCIIATICLQGYYRLQNKKAERGEIVINDHEDFRYQP